MAHVTEPEPRREVVDLLVSEGEYGVTFTPEQRQLMATATTAEHQLADAIMSAEADSLVRYLYADPGDVAEETAFRDMMPEPAIFEGLPAHSDAMLVIQMRWPWDDITRKRLVPVMAKWSPEDRRALEERFALLFPDGFHWPR
jgi:hypothetical protein